MLRSLCAVLPLLAMAGAAGAHPGHSTPAATFAQWLHLMLSPDHLFGTISAAVLAIGLAIAVAVRRPRRERAHDSR